MNVGKGRKRIFGASILLLMTALAICTAVVFAAEGGEPAGSYTLTIEKRFADGTPPEAQNVEYTFRVQAEVKSGGESNSVEKIVKITGEDSETISFDNAFKISVIEQTDDGGFQHEGADWDVVKTECLSYAHVGQSEASVNISKDGGMIPDHPTGERAHCDVPDHRKGHP